MERAKGSLGTLILADGYCKTIKETTEVEHLKKILMMLDSSSAFSEAFEKKIPIDFEEFFIINEKTNSVVGFTINLLINKNGNAQ